MDTTQFYKNVAPEFSKTRQAPWPGWEKLWDYIKMSHPKSIADLGCGNGRFYAFLQKKGWTYNYDGYDNNDYFLQEAKQNYNGPNTKFIKKDIFTDLSTISERYDMVVAIAIAHHFTEEIRQNWFEHVTNIMNPNGILVLTFWEYDKDSRLGDEKIGPDDWLLDFNNSGNKRYFHKYTDEELKIVLSEFEIVETYLADGKDNNLNRYFVLKN